MASRFAQIAFVLIILLSLPAHAQTIGGTCSGAGSTVNGVLIGGRYTDLVCDGQVYQSRSSWTTGSSSTAATNLTQIGVDNGSCTALKTGRITYNSETDTLCYCSGSAWTKWGGTGSVCNDSAAANTVLLLKTNGVNFANNNTFTDSSANNFTLTRNGNVTQGMFSPFNAGGGSLYFDGNGDYLTIPSNSAFNLSGDFTVEAWIYLTAYSPSYSGGYASAILGRFPTGVSGNYGFAIDGTASSYTRMYFTDGASNYYSNVATINLNTWYHIAYVRTGSTVKMYLNGSEIGSVTNSSTMTNSNQLTIGRYENSTFSYQFPGYLSNIRISNKARYPATFTQPTQPFAPDANTILLLKGENAGIADVTRNNDIETVNSAYAVTFPTKNDEASMSFGGAGTGDGIRIPNSTQLNLSNSNFTIEGWIYPLCPASTFCAVVAKGWLTPSANFRGFLVGISTSGILQFFATGNNTSWNIANAQTIGTPVSNTWSHFAVTRSGNTWRTFLNGTQGATWSSTGTISTNTYPVTIAMDNNSTPGNLFGGYLYDLRLTKGSARYTSAFTPPIGPMNPP